jgi:hypothetical protein
MNTAQPLAATAHKIESTRPLPRNVPAFHTNQKWIVRKSFGRLIVNVQPFGTLLLRSATDLLSAE